MQGYGGRNITFRSHVYWHEIAAFQLSEDTYESWALFAVTEGAFRYEIGGQEGLAGAGDLVLCPPGTLFARKVVNRLSFHFFFFDGEEGAGRWWSGRRGLKDRERLRANDCYLAAVGRLYPDADHPTRGLYLLDLLQTAELELQLAAVEKGDGQVDRDGTVLQEGEREDAVRMQSVVAWLTEHYADKLSLKEAAAQWQLSPVQLTRKFKAYTGETPMDYLTSLRLEKARELLLHTRLNLNEIAEACGYDNGYYLSRVFHSKIKMPPSVYRQRHQV
ncbi:helix-turn-helix domain-containing protein [Paenibacillus swuensis]|uniref:helix-turn-helix domain-containing protein n=1 Tax=Paenibacillus swuensis TaxID=1178515 RepID=UPI000AFE5CD9|nr:AraC family transcriptional regulator [Paenibacillus swuensis]